MSVQSSRTSRPAHSSRSSWVHSGIQIASVQMALCIYTRVMMCGVRGPNYQKCRFRSTDMCDCMSPEASCVVRIKSLTLVFRSPPTRWMSGFSILTRHALSGHVYKAVTLNAFPPLVLIWRPALIHVYAHCSEQAACCSMYPARAFGCPMNGLLCLQDVFKLYFLHPIGHQGGGTGAALGPPQG